MTELFTKKPLRSFRLSENRKIIFLATILLATIFAYSTTIPSTVAVTSGAVLDFFVTVKPDFAGQGFDAFSPQLIVIEEGDQINLTIRNLGSEQLHLQIEGQLEFIINAGVANGSQIVPVESNVAVFSPAGSGIFIFETREHPEMRGEIVVLPANWANYKPQTKTRSLTQVILPDFAGNGYDKFFPGVIVVNQGDLVNVTVRNTDSMAHGFAIGAYGLDVMVNPASNQPNGTVTLPTDTVIQTFTASNPGVYDFICTVPCGLGHSEMVGTFVVLPTGGASYQPLPNNRYEYLAVIQDFAGEGYDKYLPGNLFVNQNDLVNIKIRNTDQAAHGFAMPDCGVNNQTVDSASLDANGSLVPADTYITEFFATKPGIHEFFCTNNCGAGHDQMLGYLTVLPSQAVATNPKQNAQTTSSPMNPLIFALLSLALLVAGILIGIIVIKRFEKNPHP